MTHTRAHSPAATLEADRLARRGAIETIAAIIDECLSSDENATLAATAIVDRGFGASAAAITQLRADADHEHARAEINKRQATENWKSFKAERIALSQWKARAEVAEVALASVERERDEARRTVVINDPEEIHGANIDRDLAIARAVAAEAKVLALSEALKRIASSNAGDMNTPHPEHCATIARAALSPDKGAGK